MNNIGTQHKIEACGEEGKEIQKLKRLSVQ
jgi:hypothetical protein